jgi:hypothetical protein
MWQVTTDKSIQKAPPLASKNGFVSGDWEVITTAHPRPQQLDIKANLTIRPTQTLPISEIDELVEVLGNLRPEVIHRSSPTYMVSQAIPEAVSTTFAEHVLPTKKADRVESSVASRVINELAIPRQADAPEPPPLSAETREQLLKLRATIMVEAEQRKMRSVLICGAAPEVSTQSIAADLSRLLAEYKRLKIAFIEVAGGGSTLPRNKVLSPEYTFRIRRTRTRNLYEIASSQGVVKLEDWLKNWTPSVVLGELEKMFDLVLICAPAVTSNPEVALLAGAVDGVILVATENVTSFASLGEAQHRLRNAEANVLGVTLTKAASIRSPLSVVKSRMRGLMNFIAVIK